MKIKFYVFRHLKAHWTTLMLNEQRFSTSLFSSASGVTSNSATLDLQQFVRPDARIIRSLKASLLNIIFFLWLCCSVCGIRDRVPLALETQSSNHWTTKKAPNIAIIKN